MFPAVAGGAVHYRAGYTSRRWARDVKGVYAKKGGPVVSFDRRGPLILGQVRALRNGFRLAGDRHLGRSGNQRAFEESDEIMTG